MAGAGETAELLVSELVANAVRHARSTDTALQLLLENADGRLRIEVVDADPRLPQPRMPGQLDESGFGFVLIEALASAWGTRPTGDGKGVWAELMIEPRKGSGPDAGGGCQPTAPPATPDQRGL